MANIKSSGNKPQIDIEKVRYCDTFEGKEGVEKVEFLRCFVYKNGVLSTTNDYEQDGTTPYVVQGEVTRCIEEVKTVFKKYVFKKGIIPNGVTEQFWQIDRDGVGNGVGTVAQNPAPPITDIFSDTDECGVMKHPNDGNEDSLSVLPQAIPTDPNFGGDSAAWVAHESCLDFWLCVDQPGVKVAARVNGFSSYAAYFGTCNGKLALVEQGINTTAAGANFIDIDLGTVGQGFFHVRLYSHDPYQFGKTILQWSLDNGATYVDIPTENLISERPSASCVDVTCDADGKLYFLDSGEEILEADYKCFACDPCQTPTGLPQAGADEDFDVEQLVLCDKALTGEITKFIRHFQYTDGVLVGQTDTLLDGTAYTPSGIVSDCEKDCNSVEAYWNTTIQVADGAIGTLDLSSIGGNGEYCEPQCAKISIVKGNGVFTYHIGGEPNSDLENDYTGHPVNECDQIELGCCGCSGGSARELKDFKITPNAGETLILSVTFCRPK